MNATVSFTAISDVGCVRSNNEDMAYAAGRLVRDSSVDGKIELTDGSVAGFTVADGMGGYEGGEVASEIVSRSFAEFVRTFDGTQSDDDTIRGLKEWARRANRLVLDTADIRPELSEMGTTFVGLFMTGSGMWLVNIGDSRCYRMRQGILKQLSTDHSERQRTGNPDVPSNLIYNFMGNTPDDFISDITALQPLPGDIYLLCSDGLSDLINDDDIEAHIETPQQLVDMAKAAGGRDNITVITLKLC